jgi:DNA-binding response OmpR family regulator
MLSEYLTERGYQVVEAGSAREFLQVLEGPSVDLIVLDLTLPDGDGLDLLRKLHAKKNRAPVFVVTGRSENTTRLAALELLANDYITKPFSLRELELRIRNFLNVRGDHGLGSEPSYRLGVWTVQPDYRVIQHDNGIEVSLTRAEMNLLCALLRSGNTVCSRDALLDSLEEGLGSVNPETLTVLVSRLRKKLRSDGQKRAYIVTVQGMGYRLVRDGNPR